MSRITSSASKITLLLFALTVCVGFVLKLLSAELFVPLATMVLGFYFGSSKGQKDDINTPQETV
jgi:hypothetical protein